MVLLISFNHGEKPTPIWDYVIWSQAPYEQSPKKYVQYDNI